MAKKKKSSDDAQLNFEQAVEQLEEIVHELEEGRLGLTDSLARYERGIGRLRRCYHLLDDAERKIELLTGVDEQGRPQTEAFDEEEMSLNEKAEARGRRRSHAASAESNEAGKDTADAPQTGSSKRSNRQKAARNDLDADNDDIDSAGSLF